MVMNPPAILTNLFNQFNDFSSDQNQDFDNIRNFKYYNMDEIKSLNKLNNKTLYPLSIKKACSLSKNIGDLELLVYSTQIGFDVIVKTETKIVQNKYPVNDIKLTNYSYECCPTESSSKDKRLQTEIYLSYKLRNDLCIYKTAELKSKLIELIKTKNSKIN